MKFLYGLLLVAFLSIHVSCNKYLERTPLEGPSDATYFSNETELQLALNGCYAALNFSAAENLPNAVLLDAASDIGWDRNNSALQQLGKGAHDGNNAFTLAFWRELYRTIGRCNFLLDNIGKLNGTITPAAYGRAAAEARFIRAVAYHYLLEFFGDIPLITQGINLSTAQAPKNPRAQVVDFILSEFNEILTDLPDKLTGLASGKASKGAALAFRARVALFNGRWTEAAASAKAVMDMSAYSLHNNFGELFNYAGQTSGEIMFSLQYLKGIRVHGTPAQLLSRMGQGFSSKVPSESLVDSYECIDGLPIDQSPLYDINHPYDNRDPRLGQTLALPGSNYYNYKFETHKDSIKTWNYNTVPATRVDNLEATHAFATFTGFCWRKYVDLLDKDDRGNSELNVIAMRYAEVLLIYAEAKIEANDIDASVYEAINRVRQRPGVNMPAISNGKSQEQLRSIVRKERKYEFAGEGLRLFDIRRWGIAGEVMNGAFYGRVPRGYLAAAPAIDENGTPDYANVPNLAGMRVVELRTFNNVRDILWPIPNIEILTNKQLVQNPGY